MSQKLVEKSHSNWHQYHISQNKNLVPSRAKEESNCSSRKKHFRKTKHVTDEDVRDVKYPTKLHQDTPKLLSKVKGSPFRRENQQKHQNSGTGCHLRLWNLIMLRLKATSHVTNVHRKLLKSTTLRHYHRPDITLSIINLGL